MSALSGVPVPTLRVWQSRYGAFAPAKTAGQHRLYRDEDVLRASLLRQLTDSGHAISTIAGLDAQRLTALLNQQRQSQGRDMAAHHGPRTVSVAVIGLALAARLQSEKFIAGLDSVTLRVAETLPDLDNASVQGLAGVPDILMVRVNSLHMGAHAALRQLIGSHAIGQVIVLYSFGQERVAEAMKMAGMTVRREPVSDSELADLVHSVLFIDTRAASCLMPAGAMIPPRKYSDQTLMAVAGISTQVLCECPRHVAELIAQLASFEQYSQDCLNNSQEDAHLHAQLAAISGSARALFERALEMVARHEGIALEPR